jgi:hypothetical protein
MGYGLAVDVAARPAAVPLPPAAPHRTTGLVPAILAVAVLIPATPAESALLPPPQRLARLHEVPEWDPAAGRADLAPLRAAAAGDIRIVPAGGG